MDKAFVDTTILCDILLPHANSAAKIAARAALARYKATSVPTYAFVEFRSGPLGYYIFAHNQLAIHDTIGNAVASINTKSAYMPRKGMGSLNAIIRAITHVAVTQKVRPNGQPEVDVKRQLQSYLRTLIVKAWNARHQVTDSVVRHLSCFMDEQLQLVDGQLRLRGTNTACMPNVACGAAIELKNMAVDVQKVIDVLRPSKGEVVKPESSSRRNALKELLSKPSGKFPRNRCRALGDAYFCIMAPSDHEILTTNTVDFVPMATVLKKQVGSV